MRLHTAYSAGLLATASLPWLTLVSARDTPTILSRLADLTARTDKLQTSFREYDGGVLSSLSLAKELFLLQGATQATKESFEDAEPIADEDLPAVLEHYHAMRVSIETGLNELPSMMEHIDSSRVRVFAIGVLEYFAQNRGAIEMASKAKIPKENHTLIRGPVESLAKSFDHTLRLFK